MLDSQTDCNKVHDAHRRYGGPHMNRLRDISLSVEEQEPGHFYWVLMESSGDDLWSELASAEDSVSSWACAFHAGCLALGILVPQGTICLHHGRFAI
jgi:hypothetical protein